MKGRNTINDPGELHDREIEWHHREKKKICNKINFQTNTNIIFYHFVSFRLILLLPLAIDNGIFLAKLQIPFGILLSFEFRMEQDKLIEKTLKPFVHELQPLFVYSIFDSPIVKVVIVLVLRMERKKIFVERLKSHSGWNWRFWFYLASQRKKLLFTHFECVFIFMSQEHFTHCLVFFTFWRCIITAAAEGWRDGV